MFFGKMKSILRVPTIVSGIWDTVRYACQRKGFVCDERQVIGTPCDQVTLGDPQVRGGVGVLGQGWGSQGEG